jgi:hypothetical protein
MRPPTLLDVGAESQNPNQGEGPVIPEHSTYAGDFASGIQKLSESAQALNMAPGIKEKVLKSLTIAKRKAQGEIEPKQLKKGKKVKDGNVAEEKHRQRKEGCS